MPDPQDPVTEVPRPQPLAGDRPIDSPEQDTIGRAGFARQIQHEIETSPRDEGLVLAVTGEWGSGKTSVVNLALGPLDEQEGYRIVRFNPWLFSGTPQLVEHFFTELMAQLKASGNSRLKEIGEALERYGEAIDPLRFLPGADKAAALSRAMGRILRGPDLSIERQREKLNRLLASHDELLVIVVDDIDRSHEQEVADVMRLVRLVADFPNTVYVLAFDADRVAQAISGEDPQQGRVYIEKIVQIAHEVPAISGEQLSQMLLERIDRALEGISYRLDQQRWSKLYLTFRSYLCTPRDVSRYCNHIRSPMWLLATEIEAADVLALEALRLFERTFWTELPRLIPELTRLSGEPNILSSTPAPNAERLKQLVDAAQQSDTLRELVQELFPAAAQRLGGSRHSPEEQGNWRHARRVADPTVLQAYLSKQIQPSEVPTTIVERVVAMLGDADALRQELERLNSSQLADLLTRLEDYEGRFPDELAPAIPVLYRQISRLPPRTGMLEVEPGMRVTRVVLRMLRGRPPSIVAKIVEQAATHLALLSDRWSLVRLVGHIDGSGHQLVSESQAKQSEDELVQAILGASPSDLAAEPDLPMLLRLVMSHEPAEASMFARHGAENDRFLLRLLSSSRHEVRSDFGRRLQLSWDMLAELLGEQLLVRRVSELPDPPAGTDEDTLEMLAQARRYAADPQAAARDLEEYRRHYPG
jgi:hypothetical protein